MIDTSRHSGNRLIQAGFTLVELMVVVAIMGLVAGFTFMTMGGVTDEQKLGSAMREFVGTYRELRAFAIKDRRECTIEYDMIDGVWRTFVYPYRDGAGKSFRLIDGEKVVIDEVDAVERSETKAWNRLPKDIFIVDIQAPGPDGNETFREDYWLKFRTDGTIPPHIVHFKTKKGLQMSLEVEELTGRVTIRRGYLEFYSPQAEEFDNLSGGGDGR